MKQVGGNYQLEAGDVAALETVARRYPLDKVSGYLLVDGGRASDQRSEVRGQESGGRAATASFVFMLNFARPGVNPGVVAVPVVLGVATVGPGMFLAVGERADLSADEWVVLWSSESEGPQRMVAREAGLSLGADPASVERDPDAVEDALPGPTVVDVIAAVPVGDFGEASRRLCVSEGRVYGDGMLGIGLTVADVRRESIVPCPYALGTPQRVWWMHGLLGLLLERELAEADPVPELVAAGDGW